MDLQKMSESLKTGDLLFVPDTHEDLSQIIAKSTMNETDLSLKTCQNYTHVGVLEYNSKYNDFFVLHATPIKGCIRETLTVFLNNQQTIDVYRLKKSTISHKTAIQRGKKLLGEPYNSSFIAEQPGYYCSEFICALYKNVFAQTPMSFGPNGSILPEWHDYYKKLDLPIPNKLPGSSPNSLLSQGLTAFITTLHKE
ncbi:YiiX/YebB-like N1pC/P60 family cysteine hydrolase [Liquorilactobacillus hordei]|uniref:Uncharacterized protein n=1 Tax=Liquorilactobacillus hordei DSM 19519 TaxID=1423759 RepID=A0A0R1MGA9_9LACO|nr:YiiX/YebB-like N1pC/P60 family cysteine hydrolase [Liquorilactobacillus hordei]KRL07070.1 hypothetical protein FC92_GL000188 [Liquorilactobacillus hordei DSM 19519]MBZ2405326.1 hypothetical protein [Liquorilactobacillus hordei]QYH52133.1 hypothetical protein G6O70_06555 [Liquorilactobacillus hordei DSM 19519]